MYLGIPQEDAIDGQTSFSASANGYQIGDKVTICELEGCLGIRWFELKFQK